MQVLKVTAVTKLSAFLQVQKKLDTSIIYTTDLSSEKCLHAAISSFQQLEAPLLWQRKDLYRHEFKYKWKAQAIPCHGKTVCSNRWILQPEILHFIVLHGQSPTFIIIRKTARGSWWATFFFFLNKKTASGQPQCRELCWTQRTTLRSQPGIQASQHILFRLSSLPLFFRAECLSFLLLAPASPRSSETGKPAAMQFGFLHWTSCPG